MSIYLFIVYLYNFRKCESKRGDYTCLFLYLLSKCAEAEQESTSVSACLSSCTEGVMEEISGVAEEGLTVLEEGAGYCGFLQSSLESITDSSLQWCHAARVLTERRAEEQLTLTEENKAAVQELLKVTHVGLTGSELCIYHNTLFKALLCSRF